MLRQPEFSDGGGTGVVLKPATGCWLRSIRQGLSADSHRPKALPSKPARVRYLTGTWPKSQIGYINRKLPTPDGPTCG